mgnify:CR=1 FL=1
MQVVSKIDQLITELTNLKPTLSNDPSSNEKRFSDLLKSSLENDQAVGDKEKEVIFSGSEKLENEIPSWVDPDYAYDPKNPRKPNMRELMGAMSGKNIENLYEQPEENWRKISRQASDILYGVVGAKKDTRDWLSIMASKDVMALAREQTGAMYKPEVDIQSKFDKNNILIEQMAIIKDNKGNVLRSLSSNITASEEALLNYGVTKASIPTNIEAKIDLNIFDDDLLDFLKNFDNEPASIQQVVVQSASEVIANKLSQDIPLDELAKL